MLKFLAIENFALIDQLEVEFRPGFFFAGGHLVSASEDPGQRRFRIALTITIQFGQAGGFPEKPVKLEGLVVHFPVETNFLDNDGPGNDGENHQNDQYCLGNRTAVEHQ